MKNLIKIEVLPQMLDSDFHDVMDEAYKQVRIAEAAPEMLTLLDRLLLDGISAELLADTCHVLNKAKGLPK